MGAPAGGRVGGRRAALRGAAAAGALGALGLGPRARPARAFGQPFDLTGLSYKVGPCPAGTYVPGGTVYDSKVESVCLRVSATAQNVGALEAADVFGFVENSEGASVLSVNPDGTTRTAIASILQPLKPQGGTRVEFTLVALKDRVKGDLVFRNVNAQPTQKNIADRFAPLSTCELEPESEGCEDGP